MKPSLLYVDDERTASSGYRKKLDPVFDVHYFSTVPSYTWLETKLVEIGPRLIVQDVMLPRPGETGGVIDNHVGIQMLKEAKDTIVDLGVKVIIFSNRIIKDLEQEVADLAFPANVTMILYKPDTGFKQLHDECVKLAGI